MNDVENTLSGTAAGDSICMSTPMTPYRSRSGYQLPRWIKHSINDAAFEEHFRVWTSGAAYRSIASQVLMNNGDPFAVLIHVCQNLTASAVGFCGVLQRRMTVSPQDYGKLSCERAPDIISVVELLAQLSR
jgi:hypothetical protein